MAPPENLLERCRNLKAAHAEYLAAKAAHDNFLIVKQTNVGSGAKSLDDIRTLLEKVLEEKSAFYRSLPTCQSLQCRDHPKPRTIMLSPGKTTDSDQTPSQNSVASKNHGKRERTSSQNSTDSEGFTLVNTKKAAKKAHSLSAPSTATPTSNSFAPIDGVNEAMDHSPIPTRPKKVHSVQIKMTPEIPFWTICSTIKAAVKGATCKAHGQFIRVTIATEEEQRMVYHCCRENKFEYLLFQPIKDQPLKVVIKGIPRDTTTSDIEVELTHMGFAPSKVVQIKRLRDKVPLPIFQITLPRNDKSNKIYDLRTYQGLEVEVQRFIRPNQINQCYNCQGWGHSSTNCHLTPKCVKCGQNHTSRTCDKSRETPATCANCGGDHPANYRNCPAFPKPKPHRNSNQSRPTFDRSSHIRSNVNFAQAASGRTQNLAKPSGSRSQDRGHSSNTPIDTNEEEIFMDTENIALKNEVADLKSQITSMANELTELKDLIKNFFQNKSNAD